MSILNDSAQLAAYLPRNEGSLLTVDHVHGKVHDGYNFVAYHTVIVGTGTAVSVMITAPTAGTGIVNLTISVEADKAFDWVFSKIPNASGGSALTGANRNDNSTNSDPLTKVHTITYTSSGTALEGHIMGTNEPTSKLGGISLTRGEFELYPEREYLFYGSALAATTKINVVLDYYLEV